MDLRPSPSSGRSTKKTNSRDGGRWLFGLFVLGWSTALAALYGLGNDFPLVWHFDAPSKVTQIIDHVWNFRHPLLLLRATQATLHFWANNPTPQQIAAAGQWVSAVAASGAVACLALSAAYLRGLAAGVMAALLVGTGPLLFGMAHYIKEDSLHLLTLSAFLLALVHFGTKPNGGRYALLAIAAGLCVSSKYVGAITLPILFAMPFLSRRDRRRQAPGWLALGAGLAGLVFIAVNAPMFASPGRFVFGLASEIRHVASDSGGLMRPIWSTFYLRGLVLLCGPVVLAVYLWHFASLARQWRSGSTELILAVFPIAYLVMLQVSPVKVIRYELPVVAIVLTLAGCGFAALFARINDRGGRLAIGLGLTVALAFNVRGTAVAYGAFAHESRAEMAEWIRGHLPADAVVFEDRAVGMLGRAAVSPWDTFVFPTFYDVGRYDDRQVVLGGIPQKVRVAWDVAEVGSLEAARRAGITHILISDISFARFFNRNLRPDGDKPEETAYLEPFRAFYRTLFDQGELVHSVEGASPLGTYSSPSLWLFRIAPEPGDGPRRGTPMPRFDSLQD